MKKKLLFILRSDSVWVIMFALLGILLSLAPKAFPQVPAPQVPITGNIGAGGVFPLLNSGTISFSSDADHTMVYPETTAYVVRATSSVSLTSTRKLITPLAIGFTYVVANETTGGQSICVGASTGACVTIANGEVASVYCDGVNYLASISTGSGTVDAGTAGQIAQYPSSGTAVQGATISGDATLAAGGALTVSHSANSSAIDGVTVTGTPSTGQVPTATSSTAATWQTPSGSTLKPATELWGFGDSYIFGTGATSPSVTGIFGLLSRDTPASITQNNAVGGLLAPSISVLVLEEFGPNPTSSSVSITDGGANDATNDSCGGISSSPCITNFKNSMMAQEAWLTIPLQFRKLASTATQTGSWATDSLVFQPPNLTSNGVALISSSSGATLTFAIPSSASPVIGVTYESNNGATGSFTVSIDGTLQTDDCSSSTTFSAAPCTAFPSSSPRGIFRQEYAVSAGTHTVVITTLSANAVNIVSVDWVPPTGTANENAAFVAGVNLAFTNAVVYDTASKAVVTKLSGDGLPVFFVDLQHGTPGVNDTTDVSTSATTTCPASTLAQHPNDCGYANFLATVQNTEVASSYIFSQLNSGGKSVYLTGKTAVPLSVLGSAGSLAAGFSSLCTVDVFGCGATYFNNNSGDVWGSGFQQLPSSAQPWSNGFAGLNFGTTGWYCDASYDGSGGSSPSDFTAVRCTNLSTGNTDQLGTISSNGVLVCLQNGTDCPSSGITALTGDVTASGSGSVAATVVAVHATSGTLNGVTIGATTPSTAAVTTETATTSITAQATSSATSGANINSPFIDWCGSYWTGSAAAADCWTTQISYTPGANPSSVLEFTHTGSPGSANLSVNGSILTNNIFSTGALNGSNLLGSASVLASTTSSATSGANFNSPPLENEGQYWNGSMTSADVWAWVDVLGAGTNPTSTLTLTHTGSSGVSKTMIPSLGISTNVVNAVGLQVATGPACTSIAAIGDACNATITLATAEPNTSYSVVGCTIAGYNALVDTSDVVTLTTSNFIVQQTNLTTSANTTGTITCLVVHN